MKHQQAITAQRLENMKAGIKQAASYLHGINGMLENEKVDTESISEEISEVYDFMMWIQSQ